MKPPKCRCGHGRVAWRAMKGRCYNINDKSYKRYGGRGIRVCKRWMNYEMFLADMGLKPTATHSLNRINNDGMYSRRNCEWATSKEQCRNRSTSTSVVYCGASVTIPKLADIVGINRRLLYTRICTLGMTVDDAVRKGTNVTRGAGWRTRLKA